MAVRLPAEWEPQSAVMLTWPHANTDWGTDLPVVFGVMAAIAKAICSEQTLLSVCVSDTHCEQVRALLKAAGADASRLRFAVAPSNDTWARDHGPLTTLGALGPVINDFAFNGWGGKFDAKNDNEITARLCSKKVFGSNTVKTSSFVLEGGAVETDGQGTLLATRSSLIDQRRNPDMDCAEIEAVLTESLGIHRYLWLDHGALSGDDTDSHIDTLARFVDRHTIAYATVPEGHPDSISLQAMAEQLQRFRTVTGEPYRLVPLPFPGWHTDDEGRLLPASYANFLIVNHQVLLPIYGVDNDQLAIACLRELTPDRRIVPIDCRPIIRQNGSLHCLTMQFPAALTVYDASP